MAEEIKLNRRERYKAELAPFDYLKELHTVDFDSIGEGDRYYLQDCGIYTSEIDEDLFALRLRFNAGRITPTQLRLIAKVVKDNDLEIVLTARAQMQLHGFESDNVYDVWKELNENGISTWQTFGDNVRNIVTDAYDGVGKYAEIEVYPYVQQMQEYILNKPRFVGLLPRRISIGVSGNSANVTSFFANDMYMALAEKEGVKGFNVYLGGKNTEIAQDANIFLKPEELLNFFIAFVESFHKHGSRGSRSKTRVFHWIELVGMDAVKACIKEEYSAEFVSAGKLILQKIHFNQVEELSDGTYSYCYHTDFARVSSDEFNEIAEVALANDAEIRLGIDHHIYLIGLKSPELSFKASRDTSTVSSCAGSEYCPFSYWSIKDETAYLPLDKINEHNIHVGFSGCLKGCGKHQHADIGIVGLKTSLYGSSEKAARIFIGGEHSYGEAVAKQLFFLIPLDELDKFLRLIIAEYEAGNYKDFESFSKAVLNQYSADFLALWFLAKYDKMVELNIPETICLEDRAEQFAYEKALLVEHFSDREFSKNIDEKLATGVSMITKRLFKDKQTEDASASFFALNTDENKKNTNFR